jgi:hypothetical protein
MINRVLHGMESKILKLADSLLPDIINFAQQR